jgi:hypothetical protein
MKAGDHLIIGSISIPVNLEGWGCERCLDLEVDGLTRPEDARSGTDGLEAAESGRGEDPEVPPGGGGTEALETSRTTGWFFAGRSGTVQATDAPARVFPSGKVQRYVIGGRPVASAAAESVDWG